MIEIKEVVTGVARGRLPTDAAAGANSDVRLICYSSTNMFDFVETTGLALDLVRSTRVWGSRDRGQGHAVATDAAGQGRATVEIDWRSTALSCARLP